MMSVHSILRSLLCDTRNFPYISKFISKYYPEFYRDLIIEFKCPYCGLKFSSKYMLYRHIMIYKSCRKYVYRKLTTAYMLYRLACHVLKRKSNNKYTCLICSKTFNSIEDAIIHVVKVHGVIENSPIHTLTLLVQGR